MASGTASARASRRWTTTPSRLRGRPLRRPSAASVVMDAWRLRLYVMAYEALSPARSSCVCSGARQSCLVRCTSESPGSYWGPGGFGRWQKAKPLVCRSQWWPNADDTMPYERPLVWQGPWGALQGPTAGDMADLAGRSVLWRPRQPHSHLPWAATPAWATSCAYNESSDSVRAFKPDTHRVIWGDRSLSPGIYGANKNIDSNVTVYASV